MGREEKKKIGTLGQCVRPINNFPAILWFSYFALASVFSNWSSILPYSDPACR